MSEKKIISFAEVRAAKAAKPAKPPRRLMVLEVMSPDQPGGRHHGRLIDAYVDPSRDAPANLEQYASALEEVASRLRSAATRDVPQRDAC